MVGWESEYEVSTLGVVRSLPHRVTRKNGTPYTVRGGNLRPGPSGTGGHLRVGLWRNGKCTDGPIHQLVIEAFLGPCPDGLEILHRNGDPTDNRLENLRYGTHAENMADMTKHGTHGMTQRTHCPSGHEYTEANTYRSPKRPNSRDCRRCISDRAARYKQRRKETRA